MWNDDSAPLTLTDCTVSGNSAGDRGGGLYTATPSTTTLTNCAVSGNSVSPYAFGDGGGLAIDGTAALTGCTISGDFCENDGGGVWTGGSSTVTLTDCTISGDSASDTGDGGGIYNTGIATLTNCTVTANYAFTGGGLFNGFGISSTPVVTLEDTIVAGNTAPPDNFSDIYNDSDVSSSSAYNLIGTGGTGGLTNRPERQHRPD